MVLARWQATIVDESGNIQPSASVEVRRESTNSLVSLFSDRDGLVAIGNPFTADAEGFAAFHVIGGAYRVTATLGSFSRVWRYAAVGLAAEQDALSTGINYLFNVTITDVDPGNGYISFNNSSLASVTQIYADNLGSDGQDLTTWLDSLDNGGDSADRGVIQIESISGFLLATVTGSVVDGAGYRKVSCTVLSSTGSFFTDQLISINFMRAGTDGTDGEVSGPASAVTGQLAVFGDTSGDVIAGAVDAASPPNPILATDVLVADVATVAEVQAATAGAKVLTAELLETAAAGEALSDAATVAVNWENAINFTLTVTANRVIGNPTNGIPGTWRTILVQGNDATDRTITFGNQYLGEVPVITNCDNTRWYLLMIYCVSTTHFVVSAKRAMGT